MSNDKKNHWNNWIKRAGIRAIRTFAQSAIAGIGVASAMGTVDWKYVVSMASMAALISLLTSITGLPEVTMEDNLEK